jgi:threonine dehydratase
MPRAASELKVAATRSYGAEVDLESETAAEAFDRTQAIAAETGRIVLHPYDDYLVMAGQGTVGLEICEDAPDVDVVVVPVGGGGLISGIATAVKSAHPEARIVGVQPEAVGSLKRSLKAARPMPTSAEPTAADALSAPVIGTRCLDVCAQHLDDAVNLTEDELRHGLTFVYQRAKLAAEVGGAAAVAALLAGKVPVAPNEHVVAVVSGGNISEDTLVGAFAANR